MDERRRALEDMVNGVNYLNRYVGLRVLVTGHTGFKGGWLATWLRLLGAEASGLALPPADHPNLFEAAAVAEGVDSIFGDIREPGIVDRAFEKIRPDIVFHLAAQPLVRISYADPQLTFATNVMGTVHVIDAARSSKSVKACVVITSDKCYEPSDSVRGHRETDRLGGSDPYSASKACAELVVSSFRQSYLSRGLLLASARAGNVLGGGDWAADRLVPDIARAVYAGGEIGIRNPDAVRPWQYVLEPLRGYLMLGARLLDGDRAFADAWNFGPSREDAVAVGELAQRVLKVWGEGGMTVAQDPEAPNEAPALRLETSKAEQVLGYRPLVGLDEAIELAVDWYKGFREGRSGRELTEGQIHDYAERIA